MTDKKQPTAEEYFYKAGEAFAQENFHKAITFYEKSLKICPDNVSSLINMGFSYAKLGKYEEAIQCYDNGLELDTYVEHFLFNKAMAFFWMEKYNDAIRIYHELLDRSPNYINAWSNMGVTYDYLDKYKEALECYEAALNINSQYEPAMRNIGWTLAAFLKESKCIDLSEYEKLGEVFFKAKYDIIDVLVTLRKKGTLINPLTIAKAMLQGDRHFKNTVGRAAGSKLEAYKDIYVRSLQIVALLHVDLKKYEKHVAHYTRRGVAELFLAAQSKFRLNTITTANDPSEGKTLLRYLDIEEDDTSSYQAFVGSFIFNPDCLNQFRLYGKEDGREATGVSITVSDAFFSEVAAINKGLQLPDAISKEEEQKEQAKESLYRCIYIDPHTDRVVSVGQKEEYIFYREDIDIKDETIQEYKKYKAEIKKEVESSLQELKAEIAKLINAQRTRRDKKRAQQILSGLLIHLRYLVKHVAFREEQECRIIKVEKVDSKNDKVKIDAGSSRMYCETIQLRNDKECYITDIHFGPKATGKELFEDILKRLDLKKKISLHQSDHPFFS